MHEDLFREIQEMIENGEPDSAAYAAPRGNAKSTIVSFALPIWVSVYKKKHYIIIVSDTADQANDFLTNIRAEFEDNMLLVDDFGEMTGLVWTTSDLILKNDVRIQALGAGKKIRGRRHKQYRPDLIIGDDLENDENIMSSDQRKKTETWQTKALSKAGDRRTDKIFIGTILHYDSLLAKLLKNPTYRSKKYQSVITFSKSPRWVVWEQIVTDMDNLNRLKDARFYFEQHKEEMLEGTKVLWPDGEDYYSLMVQKIADGPAAFSSEKQNEPLSDDERRFLPEWIRYYDDDEIAGQELFIAGVVDPSMGKQGSDYSSIITAGSTSNHIIYILDADIERRHPDLIITDVIAKHKVFHYKLFGVETVAFQEYFKDSFRAKIDDEQIDLQLKGIKTHSDKILRIQSLQPDIKNGRVRFKREQKKLIEQLINFPSDAHDDGPDSLELLVSMLGKRSAVADYYKDQAYESTKPVANSIIQNFASPGLYKGIYGINR